MTDGNEEGWYTDPFGRHEARWMSAGAATKLVRDGEVESYEDPPDGAPTHPCLPIVASEAPGPEDLYRADDADPAHESLAHRMAVTGEQVGGVMTDAMSPDNG